MTAEGLLRVFTFTANPDEYGGPIAIFNMVGQSYQAGLQYSIKAAIQNVVYIGAVLSANLGVLNLFPIPALDGGRIFFILVNAYLRSIFRSYIKNFISSVFCRRPVYSHRAFKPKSSGGFLVAGSREEHGRHR